MIGRAREKCEVMNGDDAAHPVGHPCRSRVVRRMKHDRPVGYRFGDDTDQPGVFPRKPQRPGRRRNTEDFKCPGPRTVVVASGDQQRCVTHLSERRDEGSEVRSCATGLLVDRARVDHQGVLRAAIVKLTRHRGTTTDVHASR